MTHLFGIEINENLPLWKALSIIPGIGKNRVNLLIKDLGLNPYSSWKNLTKYQKKTIDRWLKELLIQGKVSVLGKDYFRQIEINTEKYMSLGSYRGIRRRWGYPVRGQKTHSNARTARRLASFSYSRSGKKLN